MKVNQTHYRSIWPVTKTDQADAVAIIDQTKLPFAFETVEITDYQQMIVAIKTMQVRGAPLIGASAAYGVALALQQATDDTYLNHVMVALLASRPTAVNLAWAINRMRATLFDLPESERLEAAWLEAKAICDEDVALNQRIGEHGLQLIQARKAQLNKSDDAALNVLTHCNAGWIATVDIGTALGPIYAAHDAGLKVHVWVDETRPRNQGASLTAWELGQHGVPHTVICDNAGGHLMQHGEVDMVIVGADRVTRTGDVCNKIGTYLKALAAADNAVPFYVAVPSPTIDWTMQNGLAEIPIEMRDSEEVIQMTGLTEKHGLQTVSIVPPGSPAANPAFDVTPAKLVTGIITEAGVFTPATLTNKKTLVREKQ